MLRSLKKSIKGSSEPLKVGMVSTTVFSQPPNHKLTGQAEKKHSDALHIIHTIDLHI